MARTGHCSCAWLQGQTKPHQGVRCRASALSPIARMHVPLVLYLHSKYSLCLLPHTFCCALLILDSCPLLRSFFAVLLGRRSLLTRPLPCRTTASLSIGMIGPTAQQASLDSKRLRYRHINNSSSGVSSLHRRSSSSLLDTTPAHMEQYLVAMARVLRYGIRTGESM